MFNFCGIPESIQPGSFTSLYEIGIALNVSYVLLGQVRDLGQKSAKEAIDNALKSWRLDAADKGDGDNVQNSSSVVSGDFAKLQKNAETKTAQTVWVVTATAFFSPSMLVICAIYSDAHCPFPTPDALFIIISSCLSCFVMPGALLFMFLYWQIGKRNIITKIEEHRRFCDAKASNTAKDLENSV